MSLHPRVYAQCNYCQHWLAVVAMGPVTHWMTVRAEASANGWTTPEDAARAVVEAGWQVEDSSETYRCVACQRIHEAPVQGADSFPSAFPTQPPGNRPY